MKQILNIYFSYLEQVMISPSLSIDEHKILEDVHYKLLNIVSNDDSEKLSKIRPLFIEISSLHKDNKALDETIQEDIFLILKCFIYKAITVYDAAYNNPVMDYYNAAFFVNSISNLIDLEAFRKLSNPSTDSYL